MAWADLFAGIGGGLEGLASGLQYEQQRKDQQRRLAMQEERERRDEERYQAELARREAADRRAANDRGLAFMAKDRAAWEQEQEGRRRREFVDTLPPHLRTVFEAADFGVRLTPNDLMTDADRGAAARAKRDQEFDAFKQKELFRHSLKPPPEPKSDFSERKERYRLYLEQQRLAGRNDPLAPPPLSFEDYERQQLGALADVRPRMKGVTSGSSTAPASGSVSLPPPRSELVPPATPAPAPRSNEQQLAKEADALVSQIEAFKRAGRLDDAKRAQERLRRLMGGR